MQFSKEDVLTFIHDEIPFEIFSHSVKDQGHSHSYIIRCPQNLLQALTWLFSIGDYDNFIKAYIISKPHSCADESLRILEEDVSRMPLYVHKDCSQCSRQPDIDFSVSTCQKIARWRLKIGK